MAENKLAKLNDAAVSNFMDKVKERYIEKYADDVLLLIEDHKKLEKAFNKLSDFIARIEEGDIAAVEEYKKARRKLEKEENGEEF